MHMWFDAQLDQKILDGIYLVCMYIQVRFFFLKPIDIIVAQDHLLITLPDCEVTVDEAEDGTKN